MQILKALGQNTIEANRSRKSSSLGSLGPMGLYRRRYGSVTSQGRATNEWPSRMHGSVIWVHRRINPSKRQNSDGTRVSGQVVLSNRWAPDGPKRGKTSITVGLLTF